MPASSETRAAACTGAQLLGVRVFETSFEALVPVRWESRTLVRGCVVGVWENLEMRGRVGFVWFDQFVRVERRVGREMLSWAVMCVQRAEDGVDVVTVSGEALEDGAREDRRAERLFQRFRAAVSAARMVDVSASGLVELAAIVLVAMRAF